MATLDLTAFTRGVAEAREDGVIAAVSRISLSVSNSVGDVFRIGKLPHGAIPLDAVLFPAASGGLGGAGVAKFGTSASQELFFASATYSNGAGLVRCSRRLGSTQQISLSDDNTIRYEALVMVSTLANLIGYVGDLVVYYRMPGQTL